MTTMNNYATGAGRTAMGILTDAIQKNLGQAERVIEQVNTMVINDRIVRGKALDFSVDNDPEITVDSLAVSDDSRQLLDDILDRHDEKQRERATTGRLLMHTPDGANLFLHDNALGQLSDKTNVPLRYARELTTKGEWGIDLLAENFRRILQHGNGTRFLVRAVGNEARGFLSDRYRIFDARPILDSFLGACANLGVVPIHGYALDTKVALQVLLPQVFEPIPGEPLAIGAHFQTSDFGNGALSLNIFFKRVVCLNGAIGEALMKQVHIGRQMSEMFSQETINADSQVTAMKVADVTNFAFDPDNLRAMMTSVRKAHEDEMNPKKAVEILKAKLNKDEMQKAVEAYNSPDVVMLPPGNSRYRLSNAVSFISQAAEITPERRLELDRFAGELLGLAPASKAVEV